MIYIDEQGHLITDGPLSELHAFAKGIGMKPGWFQNKHCKQPHPHYDVIGNRMHMAAIKAGAAEITSRETVSILKKATLEASYERTKHTTDNEGTGQMGMLEVR